eukprot:CAMPEP_0185024140 /NCGR_PEP_ID=MMETSP1103-20130426/7090_1 /TAXON_ID=36769 /ORGANISM="Paraphysomonas bandaiensis, Strain Caron Lab Isolate" /LENGTH=920 /DNA_ID=CAMNT_0027557021 /DNA_START=162 /DNA_END=2924 /DNA_ORIENTATION=+
MHNPRGSNDRNCERNINRNNGNRLFDSQNNAAGGYACPRAVGDESMQNEMGEAVFEDVDSSTGQKITFTQNKRLYYYEGSILPIEWTNQHGCGSNSKVSCEIILQYACEDTLDPRVDNFWPWVNNKAEAGSKYYGTQHFRSGDHIAAPRDGVPKNADDAATDTIPDNEDAAIPDSVNDRRYGMHESYDFYQLCQRTERNKGLYTADQRMRRNDRRATRQNPNGNRQGLECPEERDYYPWWAPTPWIDIAVLTDNAADGELCTDSTRENCTDRCLYYLDNTMNFNPKGYCDVDHSDPSATVNTKLNSAAWKGNVWYNNRAACEAAGFRWYEISHSDNLELDRDGFVCAKTQFSRVNQLGNAHADDTLQTSQSSGITSDHNVIHGVNANRFLWQIPRIPSTVSSTSTDYFSSMENAYKSCTLRIRYNISTGDFQQWPEDANSPGADRMVDYRNNSQSSTDTNTPLLQDPYVYIGPGDLESSGDKFVSLAVNTNQYGRTFQDRSYSFSIKPFPTTDSPQNTQTDTPRVDATLMATNINSNGGKLYNVNVRGKRGNIVNVYPSVEYDFVPNALALSSNDMIHFQWTGSDYNPRRGCNNAEGGPPDANDFVSSANANLNSRADRSNVVMLDSMAANVPKDYLGYDPQTSTLSYSQKIESAKEALLANAPCYDPNTDTDETRDDCYETLLRLAYLNQQLDGGALILRDGKDCLTEEELDAMSSKDVAENHPLNCAKMNAKPYPYFDGGVMALKKSGWFPFFSSRNNNFSNRDQTGVICVGTCPVDPVTGALQDQNPATTGSAVTRVTASTCEDTANDGSGANNNGATSCIVEDDSVLTKETFTTQEGDNDSLGDGNKEGCEVIKYNLSGTKTVEQQVTLAIVLLFVGLFAAWLAYFLYNRYQLRNKDKADHRGEKKWQKPVEMEFT